VGHTQTWPGFSTLPAFAPVLEVTAGRRIYGELLATYVGRDPCAQIMAGAVQRGNVHHSKAAMLLADLRGFSRLTDELPEQRIIQLLNAFFDLVVPGVIGSGGDVLKYIGDAVIAIFPVTGDDPAPAAMRNEHSNKRRVVIARFVRAARWPNGRRRHARHKEIRRAEQEDAHGAHLIEQLALGVVILDILKIGFAKWRSGDCVPKFAQRVNATLGGLPAMIAELMAPIEIPATQSGCRSASASAS